MAVSQHLGDDLGDVLGRGQIGRVDGGFPSQLLNGGLGGLVRLISLDIHVSQLTLVKGIEAPP